MNEYASLRFMVPSSMPAIDCSAITMRFRNSKRVRLLMPVPRSLLNSAKNSLSSSQASVGRISRNVRAFSRAATSEEHIEPGCRCRRAELHHVAFLAACRLARTRVVLGAVTRDVDQRQPAKGDAAGKISIRLVSRR